MAQIKQFEDGGTVFGSIGKDDFKKRENIKEYNPYPHPHPPAVKTGIGMSRILHRGIRHIITGKFRLSEYLHPKNCLKQRNTKRARLEDISLLELLQKVVGRLKKTELPLIYER